MFAKDFLIVECFIQIDFSHEIAVVHRKKNAFSKIVSTIFSTHLFAARKYDDKSRPFSLPSSQLHLFKSRYSFSVSGLMH